MSNEVKLLLEHRLPLLYKLQGHCDAAKALAKTPDQRVASNLVLELLDSYVKDLEFIKKGLK